ncbi:MAG: hypothetical protein VYC56_04805, partial [Actinomycetota bacterium]|nr:hypothetical protein [Actinomycetota bacterium]
MLRGEEVALQAAVIVELERRALPTGTIGRWTGRAELAVGRGGSPLRRLVEATLFVSGADLCRSETAGTRGRRAKDVLEEEVACVARLFAKVVKRLRLDRRGQEAAKRVGAWRILAAVTTLPVSRRERGGTERVGVEPRRSVAVSTGKRIDELRTTLWSRTKRVLTAFRRLPKGVLTARIRETTLTTGVTTSSRETTLRRLAETSCWAEDGATCRGDLREEVISGRRSVVIGIAEHLTSCAVRVGLLRNESRAFASLVEHKTGRGFLRAETTLTTRIRETILTTGVTTRIREATLTPGVTTSSRETPLRRLAEATLTTGVTTSSRETTLRR